MGIIPFGALQSPAFTGGVSLSLYSGETDAKKSITIGLLAPVCLRAWAAGCHEPRLALFYRLAA